jgi:hypothetical protein
MASSTYHANKEQMATLARSTPLRPRLMFRPTLLIAFAAAVITALVQSFLVPIDCDVSWLTTVNEKMLAGQRLYVDIIEVNPPASIWLYTPFVWLAHQLQLRPEAMIVAAFIAGALATSALALRIGAHLRRSPNPLIFFALLCFVELLLPLGTFAQREHAAILFAAPALTALAVLSEKRALSLPLRVIAGLAAGLVIAIKPHFALAIIPAVVLAAWQARALRPMIPAAAAAIAVIALYAAAVVVFTPEYLQLLPMLAAAYLPLHDYWLTLLRGPVVIVPLAIYALALFLRPGRVAALAAMFLIASAGFAVAGLIQGKGYLNHALPGMALGFVGLVLLALEPGIERDRRNFVLAATAALACLEVYAMASIQPIRGLAEAVQRVAPPRPSVITLGPDLLTGHPLVRNVGGRWAGSRAGMYIAVGAYSELPGARGPAKARLFRWYEDDVAAFANDVQRERPDVILVDARPELAWLRKEPKIQRAVAGYRPRARVGDVEIWVRR